MYQTLARVAAVYHILLAMAGLEFHPDVPDGVPALKAAGYRLATLTNGSTDFAENLFATAGIRDSFDRLLSVDDAPAWKPARGAYDYAAAACGTDPEHMLLVAVHPWDIHGAARAGLNTAWINRSGTPYPAYFTEPDYTVTSLRDLTGALTGDGAH